VAGSGHPLFGDEHMQVILLGLLLVAQSQSPAQTAGERYKSIRELKDIPATQVIEVMSVIAGSLGVTCAHCHTDEWVSDEHPNKVKAREMIAMTRRIDREFGGQGTITCNTCHHGRPVPPTVSLIASAGWHRPLTPAPEAPLPALDSVLQRYLTAIGGPDAIAKITSRTFSGQVTRMNGPHATGIRKIPGSVVQTRSSRSCAGRGVFFHGLPQILLRISPSTTRTTSARLASVAHERKAWVLSRSVVDELCSSVAFEFRSSTKTVSTYCWAGANEPPGVHEDLHHRNSSRPDG
jgi:hypothetical protein